MQSNEQRRVIWQHPRGIYAVIEVSGTGVFGVPYSYRETVYTQDRDARGVARKEVQPAPPNGGRPAGGPRIALTDKEEREICEMYETIRLKRCERYSQSMAFVCGNTVRERSKPLKQEKGAKTS